MAFNWAVQVGIYLLSAAVAYATRQTPEPPKPAKHSDFDVPNSEGGELWEVVGTVLIEDPQVVWDGDFSTKAIKSKAGKK